MPELTNLAHLRALCEKHGFSFSKSLGQNFIVNPTVCPRICDAAGIDKTTNVLEIGPGFGTLTRELAARANKVAAVEIDTRLLPVLGETLAEYDNVRIIQDDILKCDIASLIQREFGGGRVAVCANLPYYITSPILMRLLEEKLPITTITAMLQKEAAGRVAAQPGTRAAGAVTYAVWYYAQPSLLFNVSAGSFYPPPKVDSSVIHLAVRENLPLAACPQREKNLSRLLRAAFSQRRKTLCNAASAGLALPKQQLADAIAAAGLNPMARPEQLTLEQYIALEACIWP